jgi:HAMP domain-containing protein
MQMAASTPSPTRPTPRGRRSIVSAELGEMHAWLRRSLGARLAASSSSRRFVLIGVALITIIIGVTAVLIWMQKKASIAAYQIATNNIARGMLQQTTPIFGSMDRVLHEVKGGLALHPDMTFAQLSAAMRTDETIGLLKESLKGQSWLDALAIIDADGMLASSSGKWSLAGNDLSQQDFFIHFKADDDPNGEQAVGCVSRATHKRRSGQFCRCCGERAFAHFT